MPHAEEIAEGGLDGRGLFSVPEGPEDDLPSVEGLGGDGHPDVMDRRGPLDVGDDDRRPRLDP